MGMISMIDHNSRVLLNNYSFEIDSIINDLTMRFEKNKEIIIENRIYLCGLILLSSGFIMGTRIYIKQSARKYLNEMCILYTDLSNYTEKKLYIIGSHWLLSIASKECNKYEESLDRTLNWLNDNTIL